eukprot:gnl/MRDRNA2_/MRDRNA2_86627_c0_seq11.p1 gnl/MRDRNA2_/MRDRNA2_86627_c0~~gnl/MRDRNA2_/MRDRNA2_86627_c0_seq11.p1  ORF type:complete len:797 (+),score=26.48 gnl/MRDRNA2_/MRDRNA2_86627_c0_seq11:2170-4560(+)
MNTCLEENQINWNGKDIGNAVMTNFFNFLMMFNMDFNLTATGSLTSEITYKRAFWGMIASDKNTLFIDYNHLKVFDEDLANVIVNNFFSLDPYLIKALRNFAEEIKQHGFLNFPTSQKEFFVSFYNIPARFFCDIGALKADMLGKLVCFTGLIIRTSEVRPELLSATFRCVECSTIVENIEQNFCFTKPCVCPNTFCGNTKSWTLIHQECIFTDWQKARVQELPSDTISGSLPKSLDVIFRADMVDSVRPGDKALLSGCLVVLPDFLTAISKRKNLGLGDVQHEEETSSTYRLGFRFAFFCNYACFGHSSPDVMGSAIQNKTHLNQSISDPIESFVKEMQNDVDILNKLAVCIAPHIFGHVNVKKSIVIMILGGLHKVVEDVHSIRGDIHVLLIGDSSSAKSELLRYVSKFSPRGVYTSGRSSTAAGLTACLAKDPDTFEYMLDAGALMLSDEGICCIDDFDKISEKDKMAIHEAMEQQSITITKAGIQANLNARSSILAAANPVGESYRKDSSYPMNFNLSPAMISRFDLIHRMSNQRDPIKDLRIAEHIVRVQRGLYKTFRTPFTKDEIRALVCSSKRLKPSLTTIARSLIVKVYQDLRMRSLPGDGKLPIRITIRQLEAILRISEALARLHGCEEISPVHVNEGVNILFRSLTSMIKHGDRAFRGGIDQPNQSGQSESRLADCGKKIDKKILREIILDKLRVINRHSTVSSRNEKIPGLKQSTLIDWCIKSVDPEMIWDNSSNVVSLISDAIKDLLRNGKLQISGYPMISKKEGETNRQFYLRKQSAMVLSLS